jgi:hypothetical protein
MVGQQTGCWGRGSASFSVGHGWWGEKVDSDLRDSKQVEKDCLLNGNFQTSDTWDFEISASM